MRESSSQHDSCEVEKEPAGRKAPTKPKKAHVERGACVRKEQQVLPSLSTPNTPRLGRCGLAQDEATELLERRTVEVLA